MFQLQDRKNQIIIILSAVIVIGGSISIYYSYERVSPSSKEDVSINQIPEIKEPEKPAVTEETSEKFLALSEENLILQEKFVDKKERDVVFMESNDDVWTVSKNLKDKYKITDYSEKRSLDALAYDRLSPDGKHIVSEKLEGYRACCGGEVPDIPVYSLYIEKPDGTDKVKIEKPVLHQSELMYFDSWFPDSKKILMHFSAPDEPTQGSPFYEVGLDGKSPMIFTGIDSSTDKDMGKSRITVLGTGPAYSPNGEKMAFILNGDEIRLEDVKTKATKTILKSESEEFGHVPVSNILIWSEDGSLLLVKEVGKVSVFNKKGDGVFEMEIKNAEEIKEIVLSSDKKYIAGTYKTKGGKNIIFFINLDTKELKEFRLPEFKDYSRKINIDNLTFSDSDKLYYRLVFPPAVSKKDTSDVSELWVINLDDWKNYKLAGDVLKITETYQ